MTNNDKEDKTFQDKLSTELYENLATMEAGLWDHALPDIISVFETELLDRYLAKARKHLSVISSPEEYWIQQGKIQLLKELKEKLHQQQEEEEEEEEDN